MLVLLAQAVLASGYDTSPLPHIPCDVNLEKKVTRPRKTCRVKQGAKDHLRHSSLLNCVRHFLFFWCLPKLPKVTSDPHLSHFNFSFQKIYDAIEKARALKRSDAMTLNLDLFGQKNICFGEPKQGEIGDVRFVSVPILYGKERLTLMTDTCFSWGIQEEKSEKGYKLPILMVNKNMNSGVLEPTPHQSLFLKRFDEIVAACKKYCLVNNSI